MSRLVVVSDPQCGLTSVFKSAVSQGELDVLLLEHGQITEEGRRYCSEKGMLPDADALLAHALSNRVQPDQGGFDMIP